MRILLLVFAVALTVGCGGPVVEQQVDSQHGSPAEEQSPAAATGGQLREVVNTIGIKLVLIPAGTFTMGSPASEEDRFDDETQHQVTLTKPFYMGRTEVTQGQWKKVMGTEPWKSEDYVQGDDYPALYVSWGDAVEFCKKLSTTEGKVYRLPTEAEWEYACRGGTKTACSVGYSVAELDNSAWWGGMYGRDFEDTKTLAQRATEWLGMRRNLRPKNAQRVAQKLPNPFGLYDMHGNVYEWCGDWFADYPSTPLSDPRGPSSGSSRVLRGGSWWSDPRRLRCAHRLSNTPDDRNGDYGFRVVLE